MTSSRTVKAVDAEDEVVVVAGAAGAREGAAVVAVDQEVELVNEITAEVVDDKATTVTLPAEVRSLW